MMLLVTLIILILVLILASVGLVARKLEEIRSAVSRLSSPVGRRPVVTGTAGGNRLAEPWVLLRRAENHDERHVQAREAATPPAPMVTPVPVPVVVPEPAQEEEGPPSNATPPPLPERWKRREDAVPERIQTIARESGTEGPPAAPAAPADPHESLEARIGQRWLVRIGGLILLSGMGFLYHWSVENQVLSESARALMGSAAGLVLWGLGMFFNRRGYAALSQGFIGAGSALLQLTIFASCQIFGLIEAPVAFAGMIAITAATVVFALRQRALPLALLAQIGGLLTPFLLGSSEDPHLLLGYLCILNAGFLAVASIRNWRWLDLVGWVGTSILVTMSIVGWALGGAFGNAVVDASISPAVVAAWITALAGLFLSGWTWKPLVGRNFVPQFARSLLPANTILWGLTSAVLLAWDHRTGLGLLFAGAAAVHLLLARAFDRRVPGEGRTRGVLDAAAAVFLLAAVPGVFREQAISLAWAASSVALFFAAPRLRSPWLRLGGVAGLGLALVRSTSFQMHWEPLPEGFRAFLNADFGASLGVAFAFGAAAAFDKEGRRALAAIGGLSLLAFVAREWEVLIRAAGGAEADITASVLLSRCLTATFGFVGFALFSDRGRRPVAAGIASVLAALGGVAFSHLLGWVQVPAAPFLANGRSIGMLALPAALLGIAAVWRTAPVRSVAGVACRIHAVAGLTLPFLLLSFEAWRFFSRFGDAGAGRFMSGHAALSVSWTAYAALLLVAGIAKRIAPLRLAALGLLAVALGKVVFFDLSSLEQVYRIISFIALGLVLMAGAWVYHRFDRRLFAARIT